MDISLCILQREVNGDTHTERQRAKERDLKDVPFKLKTFVYIAEMGIDLKGYLKCTKNVKRPDKRAGLLSEHGSSQGAQGRGIANNITAPFYTVLLLKVPPLFALCCVKIFSLNQLYCSVEMQLWEALSCLFIEQGLIPPLCCMLGSALPFSLM